MKEVFAKPAVGAIIEKVENGKNYILIQTRQKENDCNTNGLIEVVGGKIREYESIFSALRREVQEETGLSLTKISGEEMMCCEKVKNVDVIGFNPFYVSQNLNGIYSLIMMSFVCEAEGVPLTCTDETINIHWEELDVIENMIINCPERIFPMDVPHLKKYIACKKKGSSF